MKEQAPQIAVTGNFSITLPAPNGAQLQVSGYIYDAESEASLNDRMDILRGVLVRQQQALEVPVLEERMSELKRMHKQISEAYADLLEKKKHGKVSSQELSHLTNYPNQLKHIEEEITKGESKIALVG